jgi:Zn-dependent protease
MESFVFLVIVFISITIHEYAHGLIAFKLGDTTPKDEGRLTLNPIAHVDIFGTIILPIILQLTIHIPLGYAKPVPINPYNFKNPKRDTMLVGLAGPISNILLALCLTMLAHIIPIKPVFDVLLSAIAINIILAIFNLIPIPPLDGSRILASFLPARWYHNYLKLQIYGIFIILALSFFRLLDWFIEPLLKMALRLLRLGDF